MDSVWFLYEPCTNGSLILFLLDYLSTFGTYTVTGSGVVITQYQYENKRGPMTQHVGIYSLDLLQTPVDQVGVL